MDAVAGGRHRRSAIRCVSGSLTVLGLLLVSAFALPASGGSHVGSSGSLFLPLVAGQCPGAKVPVNYTGALSVEGSSASPPSVGGVSVVLGYSYEVDYKYQGANTSYDCIATSTSTTTNASGGFRESISIPSGSCSGHSCVAYRGPFTPENLTLPAGTPQSYFLTTRISGSQIAVTFVEALARVTLQPGTSQAVSVLAPVSVRATASAGDGSPTTAAVAFAWRLDGNGWTVVNGSGTPALTVEAVSAGAATLSVWANGSYEGTPVGVGPTDLGLDAYLTTVTAAAMGPTTLDVGSAATLNVSGTGAEGYPYTATFDPGLGESPVTVGCATAPASTNVVTLSCLTTVRYPTPGAAVPAVAISNGYSDATWTYPGLTVAPVPSVSLSPNPLMGYAAASSSLTVRVDPGSGTPPFGPVCLWVAQSGANCQPAGNGVWSFPVNVTASGDFPVRASVVDASGTNQSGSGTLNVFSRPSVGVPTLPSSMVPIDSLLSVGDRVVGGAPPLTYWWNDSLPEGTVASGLVPKGGFVNLSYSAYTSGVHLLTLTVEDALGTVVASRIPLKVLPGPAVDLVDAGAPYNGSTIAGSPFGVSWTALDALRERLGTFSQGIRLTLDTSSSEVWVNDSLGTTNLTAANPSVVFTPSLWSTGYLNFTVASNTAGDLALAVGSPVPVVDAPGGVLHLFVSADARYERLAGPLIAHAGTRSNSTLWQITDRFGNPIPEGFVDVRSEFGSTVSDTSSLIWLNGSSSFVWVNYSAPDDGAGTVYVLSMSGETLLPPIVVPAAPPDTAGLLTLLLLSAAGIGAGVVVYLRHRRRLPAATASIDASDAELRRLAEGRAHLLSRSNPVEAQSAEELAAECPLTPAPSDSEVVEWVVGLVADGSLATVTRPDGTTGYLCARSIEVAPSVVRVDVDPALIDSAVARRLEEFGQTEGEPIGSLEE